jgi:hypothetical protein
MTDPAPAMLADGGTEDGKPPEWDGGEERACEACGSLNNVSNGFVHDVAGESWTDYDALCRECFIALASGNHDSENGDTQ